MFDSLLYRKLMVFYYFTYLYCMFRLNHEFRCQLFFCFLVFQAKRVQKCVETLDVLKITNSRVKPVVVTTKWETFEPQPTTQWEFFEWIFSSFYFFIYIFVPSFASFHSFRCIFQLVGDEQGKCIQSVNRSVLPLVALYFYFFSYPKFSEIKKDRKRFSRYQSSLIIWAVSGRDTNNGDHW